MRREDDLTIAVLLCTPFIPRSIHYINIQEKPFVFNNGKAWFLLYVCEIAVKSGFLQANILPGYTHVSFSPR